MAFTGFPRAGLAFLTELEANNTKEWFEEHRDEHTSLLMEPAKAFVVAVGQRLQSISPRIFYDTKTNGTGSLLRIYRDTRFSHDKSPIKTNISGMFWEGGGKKMHRPGFGFQLEATALRLMGGQFNFPKDFLEIYRQHVDIEESGQALANILDDIQRKGNYTVNGDAYKRVPAGYDADHPRAELLKYQNLWCSTSIEDIDVITSPDLPDIVFEHYRNLAPLEQWLAGLLVA
jgi:uncharacterized protein (TIGR02453 family)